MIATLADILFGCLHERESWPRTVKGRTYVVCLSCGAERKYDFAGLGQLNPQDSEVKHGEVVQEA